MTPPDLIGAEVAAVFVVHTDPQQYNFSGQEMKCLRGVVKMVPVVFLVFSNEKWVS